jgi:hypothetical protein
MTDSAKTSSPLPRRREKAISTRLHALSISSSESSTISGLRRMSTPSAPVANMNAAIPKYQVTSGPFIAPP